MPSDLASYLASNYLIAEPPPKSKSKKRKRKQHDGLVIADDDAMGWTSGPKDGDDGGEEEEEENIITPRRVVAAGATTGTKKKSNWKTLGDKGKTSRDDDAADAADAILASAAAETEAARRAEDEDEAPVVEGMDVDVDVEDDPNVQRMSDGTLAGLQSAASVVAQMKRQRKKEHDVWEREEKEKKKKKKGDQQDETAYRDATGRRVDISMQREAARRAALEAEEKKLRAVEALRGEVQMEEARLGRERLAQAKNMTLARRADDEELNRELKQQDRWNDPMAQFLAEKKQEPGAKNKGAKGGPVYTGPAPPNRYGIRPGYRWDGVDRGNGFEAERFKALNRRERNKGLEYAWQLDT